MKEKLSPCPGEAIHAVSPTKVFLILSGVLSGIFAVFFTLMLAFNLTDAGDMAPLMYFFLFISALGLACAAKGIDAFVLLGRMKYAAVLCTVLILLAAQLRLAKALYGNIDYDFNYLYYAGRSLAREGILGGSEDYFARYPNNLFLAVMFAAVVKISDLLGLENIKAVLTGCSLVAVDLAILFSCLCARKLWGNRAACMTALLCLPLIGFHYGIVCPYSDSFAMIFPPLFIYIYIYMAKTGTKTAKKCLFLLCH